MINYKLKDLIDIFNGRSYAHLHSGDIPLYGSGGIMYYVNNFLYEGEAILLPRKGTLSNIMYTKGKIWTVDTMYYATANAGVDPYYLYSYLSLLDLQHLDSGSALPSMTKTAYENIEVNLPDYSSQQKISKVLADLDAKIELNNKINKVLEAMAKTLYDYWFVQFDFPNENGKPYKSFGGKMVWSEQLRREIPEGWEVKKIGEVATVKAGGDKPLKYSLEKTNTYMIPIYSNGISNYGLYGFTENATVIDQCITISARGTIGYSILRNIPFVPIIRLIVVIPNISGTAKYFDEYIKNIVFEKSGSVQQQLTVPQVSQLEILCPKIDILKQFEQLTTSSIAKIEILKRENQELVSLRDWLLPMLMNGQVRVVENATTFDKQIFAMVAEPIVAYEESIIAKKGTAKSEAFFKKVVLGSHLIYSFYQEREFGHIKFMKLLYLCEQVGEMDLMTNYQKAAAGPFDKKTLASIEKYIEVNGWFKVNKESYKSSDGKTYERTFYTLTNKSTEYKKYFDSYFEFEKAKIEKLIQLLKGANSRKCEIVATTFYTWRELLKGNVLINDNSLVNGFFNFHPQKGKNFKPFDVKTELPWMRSNGVYPKN